jgi:hypothetical protein
LRTSLDPLRAALPALLSVLAAACTDGGGSHGTTTTPPDAGTPESGPATGGDANADAGDSGSQLPQIEGPTTGPGEPYIDALEQGLTISAADLGYAFEEYFVSGTAAGAPYQVRLLLARPDSAPEPFSGHVIVEPKHPTSVPFVWYFTREYLASRGHAAVEISTFPETVETTLKGANAERYADLHVTEDQTSDIFAQVGALLKSGDSPLAGVRWLTMTGHSRSAGPTWEFMDTHHAAHRLSDGAPIYDGFFPETTRTASRLGPFPDVDVPTLLINSELEVEAVLVQDGIDYRKPDSDDPGKQFRLYEIAGMPHNPSWQNPTVLAGGIEDLCDEPLNAFPYNPVVSMALDHLIRWVGAGVAPPRAERIAVVGPADAPTAVERDEHGNAVGGVRTTTVDVPRDARPPEHTGKLRRVRQPTRFHARRAHRALRGSRNLRRPCRRAAQRADPGRLVLAAVCRRAPIRGDGVCRVRVSDGIVGQRSSTRHFGSARIDPSLFGGNLVRTARRRCRPLRNRCRE